MQIRLRSLTLRLDWLMVLFPCIAAMLGECDAAVMLLLSLTAHECAHWAAARALGVSMPFIRLTPFGGMARIENPYSVSAARICAVAIAGPLANLLLLLTSAALCHWLPSAAPFALELIQINALLMSFNLLPALPLDGGRILCALLSRRISEFSALHICLWIGRILAMILILLALFGLIVHRRLNLSFLFAAAFILTSASDERRALSKSRIHALMRCLQPFKEPRPAAIYAIDASTSSQEALRVVRPHRITLFAVYHEGKLREITDDRTLIQKILEQSPSS